MGVSNNLTELYQDYVHLVCREVIDDTQTADDLTEDLRISYHLSHPVHSDNCGLEFEGGCLREDPFYTWREYSSLIYLSGSDNAFSGGEFIMADNTGRRVETVVEPKCG